MPILRPQRMKMQKDSINQVSYQNLQTTILQAKFYNFILMYEDKPLENPQLRQYYSKQNRQLNKQQHRLDIQIIRVHATQKQKQISQIWAINQQNLCDFFTHYELFPQNCINFEELLQSNNLKLIKSDGKIYFGQIYGKKRQGNGINVSREGRIYQGQWTNNQKNGRGVEIYPNGNVYQGNFLNGKKHGQGTFYWFNLSPKYSQGSSPVQYYQGQWWGGLPDGSGSHQKINGDLYIGVFKNGLKHGEGKEWFSNGDYYKGEYVNGMPQGFGEYIWQDGSTFRGDFKQGLRNGYGLWQANNDNPESYKGHYVMDKKSGYGVYVWQNCWSYKGTFQNDLRNGYGQLYDSNGKLNYRGFWESGEQTQKQPILDKGQSQINFRSVQYTSKRPQQSKYPSSNNQTPDKRSRKSLKQNDNRYETSDLGTSQTFDPSRRQRPHSHVNYKVKRTCKHGLDKSGKFTEGQRTSSSAPRRPSVGTIKSNLFVPFRHFRDQC